MVADLVDRVPGQPLGEPAPLLLQQQVDQPGGAGLALAGVALAHEHLDEVGRLGVAAPALVPGHDPLVALEDGAGRDAGEVGPGVGLGQRDRADPLAAGAAPLQLVAPVGVGHRRPEALGAGQDAGRRHPGAGQLLADHAVLEDAEAQAALLRRHGDAEVAQLGQPGQQRRRDRPFCGSSSLATGSTSSIANRRACSCSSSRSGVCHGGSRAGGGGSMVPGSSVLALDVIVGRPSWTAGWFRSPSWLHRAPARRGHPRR